MIMQRGTTPTLRGCKAGFSSRPKDTYHSSQVQKSAHNEEEHFTQTQFFAN
jgi:hypothetical protein